VEADLSAGRDAVSADGREAALELGLDDSHADWLATLDRSGDQGPDPPLHSERDGEVLERLGVIDEDAAAVLVSQRGLDRSPGLSWLLRRCRQQILAHLGDPGAPLPGLPQLPAALGQSGRCFPAHLFLATLPCTLRWHQLRGIPPAVSWATFADLSRQMEIYRSVHGITGVDEPWWLMLHLRGLLYEFGRLQYNLLRIGAGAQSPSSWYDDKQVGDLGVGFRSGDDALGVHIPDGGPLTPDACADSMKRGGEFFRRFFPSPTRQLAICESWLLDDQLSYYLPADSNIIGFQRRFTLAPGWKPGDQDVAQFIFRRAVADLGDVPQRTTLQRAIMSHIRTGGHWRVRCGWLRL
jgi:hypothetical protein